MSSIQQEIKSILKLAREVKTESIFQEKAQYKKFKAKKIGHRNEIRGLIDRLNADFEFDNEVIFWSHKFLQERICDKDEKYRTLYGLSTSYYRIKNYEKAIEFGQKFLDIKVLIPKPYFTLDGVCGLVHGMIQSSRILERDEDAMKYLKEKLKLDVLRFNDGEITKLNLLAMYIELIYAQIKTKRFDFALKTLKSLKLFSVNSKNPQDVIVAMERQGYKKYFPLSLLYIDITESYEEFSDLVVEHYVNFSEKEIRESAEMVEELCHLARICLYKCEILQDHGDRANCEKWAYIHFLINYDIQFHLRLLESIGVSLEGDSITSDSPLCETIAAALRLSLYDPTKRAKLFEDLYPAILGREKTVSYYLSRTSREYCISFEVLMPFITFCIDKFYEFKTHDKPFWSQRSTAEEGKNSKKKLISYKNSLINMNHFQAKLPSSDRDISGKEDIKFEVFHDPLSVFYKNR